MQTKALWLLMGRAALHSGQVITWDEMYNSQFQFVKNIASDSTGNLTSTPVQNNGGSRCSGAPLTIRNASSAIV